MYSQNDSYSDENISRAKELLSAGNYSCVVCRGDETFTSALSGVEPLVRFIDEGTDLRGAAAADRIVGRAAAMLYVLLGVREVYGDVMSNGANEYLTSHGIEASYTCLVERIANRAGDGTCPMENAVAEITDPNAGLLAIRDTMDILKNRK